MKPEDCLSEIERAFKNRLLEIEVSVYEAYVELADDPDRYYRLNPREFASFLAVLLISSLRDDCFSSQALYSVINWLDTQDSPLRQDYWGELSSDELKALLSFLYFLATERDKWHSDSRLSRAADRVSEMIVQREEQRQQLRQQLGQP